MRTRLASKFLLAFLCISWLLSSVFADSALCSNRFRMDPDIVGKIVDFDTRAPGSGVVVMAVWTKDVFRLVIEPKTEYYDYFEMAIPGLPEENIASTMKRSPRHSTTLA